MSKKTLNAANLERLGAERLAHLVMDLTQGNAALQRRARLELSAAQGPQDIAADLRKRFASLRRATSYIGWRKQKALVKDLTGLLQMIETGVAPEDPKAAFELLWEFLHLGPSLFVRTDDSNGAIHAILAEAVEKIAVVAPKSGQGSKALAERVLDAVTQAHYSEFDGIIPATAQALGAEGLAHLKTIAQDWADAAPTEAELEQHRGFSLRTSPEESVRRSKKLTLSVILADTADAMGDVDAYVALYSAQQLTYATIAPGVAQRLLDAGRAEEALEIMTAARAAEGSQSRWMQDDPLDTAYEACLERLGKTDALKAHLREVFEQTLNPESLRKYLKLLPDFDDLEAEEAALDHAAASAHLNAALEFLIAWPAPRRAARLVMARSDELDGNAYETLTAAADALAAEHPLAATLLRRAMITDTLERSKYKRYRHAARHLADCQSDDAAVANYEGCQTHTQFLAALQEQHGGKRSFWDLVYP